MNEDDTFRKLKRSPFDIVKDEQIQDIITNGAKNYFEIIRKHNWDIDEFTNEHHRRYIDTIENIRGE